MGICTCYLGFYIRKPEHGTRVPGSHTQVIHSSLRTKDGHEVLLLHQLTEPSLSPTGMHLLREGSWLPGPQSRCSGPQRDMCPKLDSLLSSPSLSPPG